MMKLLIFLKFLLSSIYMYMYSVDSCYFITMNGVVARRGFGGSSCLPYICTCIFKYDRKIIYE
jgi:hypothetical protein